MGFRVYAVRTGKIGKRKENDELMRLLVLVAKKYRIVKKKSNSDKYVVLYSEENNQWSKRKTIRFVAQQASKFIRDIRVGDKCQIGRYVSRRQINKLVDDNNNDTTVHALAILIVILQLLLCDINSQEYLSLVSPQIAPLVVSPEYYSNEECKKNLACTYLSGHISRLIEDRSYIKYAVDTRELCVYLVDCYDMLNRLVGENAYLAVRIKTNANGHKPIIRITPNDFPGFPNAL